MADERLEVVGVQDYTSYAQQHQFSHDLGVVPIPVASRTAGHKVIRLHGGMATRKVDWVAGRAGRPPVIPAAGDTEGDTLLSSTVVPHLPVMQSGAAGYNWRVTGSYLYVQNDPRVAGTDPFPVGNYPFEVEPAASVARDVLDPYVETYYINATEGRRFPTLIEQVANDLDMSQPMWTWPILALPSRFTSTHIIGG